MTASKKTKKKPQPADDSSRSLLLQAAKTTFAEKGYEGTSTRDIARRAGVNLSLIRYYFGGKEGLYRACLEQIGDAGLEMVGRVLKKASSREELRTRLQIFVEEFLRMQQKDLEVVLILHRDFATVNPVALDVFKTRFTPIFETLIEFFRSAQKQKILSPQVDVEITATHLFGCLTHLVRTEEVRKVLRGTPFLGPGHLEKTVAQVVLHFCDGILSR